MNYPSPAIDNQKVQDLDRKVNAINSDLQRVDERYRKDLKETVDRINHTDKLSKDLESHVKSKMEAVQTYYDKAISEVNGKKAELDDLLGHVAGSKRAENYDQSRASEENTANWLRVASVFFMLLITIIVGYSFYETTVYGLKWEDAVLRIIFAFFLTVPAGYLARESTKHRNQQYRHLQAYLTIKTIDLYIASLPEDKQHELKFDVAREIFSNPYQHQYDDKDSIHTYGMLAGLLKKMNIKKEKPGKADS